MGSAAEYKGTNKMIIGIVFGVITFWLFAQAMVNIVPCGAGGSRHSADHWPCDPRFGVHLLPTDPAGVVAYRSGYSMAGRAYLKLGIQGVRYR